MSTPNKNALKAAAYTALWVFLGVFVTSLLGWLQDLSAWASDDGGGVVFPDPSVLVKAAVSAAVAAVSGGAAAIVRLAQANSSLPGHPPTY